MAEGSGQSQLASNLNLTTEEKAVFFQLFQAADTDKLGVVTGEVAVKFFEKTKLPPPILGEIWQIADTENRGLLTPSGFGIVLRLIGHAQAGRHPSPELAREPAPLPRFEGINPTVPQQQIPQAPSSPQQTSGLIRVPPLTVDKINEYSGLFEKSGAQNGILAGENAKTIFERARLPNETLGRIWNLSDTQQRGQLDSTEFIIAMHLIASYKIGAMRGLPQTLPPGLYEAASKRGPPQRAFTGSRPTSTQDVPPVPAIPRQFTGSPVRTQSPLARQQFGTPLSAQSTGDNWLISPHDKLEFDRIFNTVDTQRRGVINGEQAVTFFSNSKLPEDVLAQIWDLADINSEGQLNKDEFAVAMFLIRQQRGKRDARGVLPSALPPNLIPPSMRHQHIPPSQPTAPAFENAPDVTKPKSAIDDLFGLDALGSPAQTTQDQQSGFPQKQAPQSTGDSSAAYRSPTATSSPPTTIFKPFNPSSTFGQSLAPNFTGSSRGAPPQASDDLLGDNDPEESRKLTADTTELANLSNQVGTLSKQMQEVQTQKSTNDQQKSQTAQQKRDFEMRLSQLRGLYEQEVKEVKAQDEQLAVTKKDVKKLQQEIALVEGSYQDLQTHHQRTTTELEELDMEKISLKERIRQYNSNIAQLKPLHEKAQSDLRQQKGLVAINKKQLATLEQEHERLKAEHESATREAEELARQSAEQATASPPAVTSPAAVISPAASTRSEGTNPFFRRPSEQATSPPVPTRALSPEHQNAFDSVFGPSFIAPSSSTPPPPTSFRTDTPTQIREVPSAPQLSGERGVPTPGISPPPSTSNDSPRVAEPPPPPQSRQITSSHLPFKSQLERSDSVDSSIKVSAPASRFGGMDHSRADTPVGSVGTHSEDAFGEPEKTEEKPEYNETQTQGANASYFGHENVVSPAPVAPAANHSAVEHFGQPSLSADMPGSFPDDTTPRNEVPPQPRSAVAAGKQPDNLHTGLADPFSGAPREQSRSPVAIKDDFDSAFDDLKPAKASPHESGFPTTNGAAANQNQEFPAIRELDDDDSSDSDSEKGFDDHFTTPPRKEEHFTRALDGQTEEPSSTLQAPRPALPTNISNVSSLPGENAEMSPPTYAESLPQQRRPSFPPEFKGLLPSRDDPTSPGAPGAPHSLPHVESSVTPAPSLPPPAFQEAAPTLPKEEPKLPNGFDDFDEDAFGNLAAAKESDDDEFGTPHHRGTDDFDPVFDSPVASKSTPVPSSNNTFHVPAAHNTANNGFDDFESNFASSTQSPPSLPPKSSQPPAADHSDWDAIFAGLDNNTTSTEAMTTDFPAPPGAPPMSTERGLLGSLHSGALSPQAKEVTSAEPVAPLPGPPPVVPNRPQAKRPTAGRAISMGTEHDDPILKRLTGMGYPREESLAALEKFDYNIDKAADYLTSKS